jgi:hypothetical protein
MRKTLLPLLLGLIVGLVVLRRRRSNDSSEKE